MPAATPATVRDQIRSGQPSGWYLLQGEDDVEKTGLAREFEALVDEGLRVFDVERIHAGEFRGGDGLEAAVATLANAARTLPMLSPRRVVIVQQAELLLAPKRESAASDRALAELDALISNPNPVATIVLVADNLDRRSKIFKTLAREATVVECGAMHDARDAEHWVRSRVAATGAEIEPSAARFLAARAGFHEPGRGDKQTGDVKRLRGEVERLLLYALGQLKITLADAREVAGPAALQDHWALANAIEKGDTATALTELAKALDGGGVPEAVLGQVAWVVRAKFPGIPDVDLPAAVNLVFRTDLQLKRTNRSSGQPRMLLERLIVGLCGRERTPAASSRRP
jgi:DNA polymerase III delta subunit